jgi:hypothetical protein
MNSIQLKNGLWLRGESERLAVARDRHGVVVLGYIVHRNDDKWEIEGREGEFESAPLAVNEMVQSKVKGHAI